MSRRNRSKPVQPRLASLVGGPFDGTEYPYPGPQKRREEHVICRVTEPPRVAVYGWLPHERKYRFIGNVIAGSHEELVNEVARLTSELPGLGD